MSNLTEFEIQRYDFDNGLFNSIKDIGFAKELWPIVYILNNSKDAYVGETTNALARFESHLRNEKKRSLTQAHLIGSRKFNKSATLDIESHLIKYLAGDGRFELLNGNLGLTNHSYFQQSEVYHPLFHSIWNQLRALGVAKHSLEHISNSDIFKYSPYKTLSTEQIQGLKLIMRSLLSKAHDHTIIEGGAGTGKTIIAIFLFKLLNTPLEDFNFGDFGDGEIEVFQLVEALKERYPKPKMALVIPMSSFRDTIRKVFRRIHGLSASMVIGPSGVVDQDYDMVVVDEAHRLRRRVNLGASFGAFDKTCERLGLDKLTSSELDWILASTNKAVFFYDEGQSIKPTDTRQADFNKLKVQPTTQVANLRSQFRVLGGVDYVSYLDQLFSCDLAKTKKRKNFKQYEFILFQNLREMVNKIKSRESEVGLSRVVAGYAWPWLSKDGKQPFDIKIDGLELKWNSVPVNWINSRGSIDEVGCIHTVQGYDLNYAGVIFGNEISYDKATYQIVIRKDEYHDRNGKQTIKDPSELKAFIINIYRTMMLRGIKGTYVYACDEALRDYFAQFIPVYESNQAEVQINHVNDLIPWVNSVPLYDLRAAAGDFSPPQKVEQADWVELPSHIKPSYDLFACRVIGNSMNRIIPAESVALFRRYSGGSRNGKIVLVMLGDLQDPDSSSHFTVKEYHSRKSQDDTGNWQHETITLKPSSTDTSYQPIELNADESTRLEVVGMFECILF